MYQLLESSGNYIVRWSIKRDLPEITKLLQSHPEYSTAGEEKIETLLKDIYNMPNSVVLVCEDRNDLTIKGLVVYLKIDKYYIGSPKYMEIPIIFGENKEVYKAMVSKVLQSLGFNKMTNAFFRAHFDLELLNTFKEFGFETKMDDDGEHIVATFRFPGGPQYDQDENKWNIQRRVPRPKLSDMNKNNKKNDNDEWGLFKDKPWKD